MKTNNNLQVILMVGCPGSGKSTWSKNAASVNNDIVRLCPDEYRAKLGEGEEDQSVSEQAFAAVKRDMAEALKNGISVLIDATLMYRKARKDFIHIAKQYEAKVIAVVFEVDEKTAIERNAKRASEGGRNVPTHIIQNMLSKYQRPSTEEGFDEIKFISKI